MGRVTGRRPKFSRNISSITVAGAHDVIHFGPLSTDEYYSSLLWSATGLAGGLADIELYLLSSRAADEDQLRLGFPLFVPDSSAVLIRHTVAAAAVNHRFSIDIVPDADSRFIGVRTGATGGSVYHLLSLIGGHQEWLDFRESRR